MKRTAKLGVESYANRYLDLVIDRLKLPSDYACAKVLDLTPQAVSKIRGGGAMSATTAAKIAEILEIDDPLRVIAEVELERSADDVWKRIGSKVAAGLLVAVGAGIAPPPASAAPHSGPTSEPLCIMSNRRRRPWWITFLPGLDPLDELLT